jgi:CRP-like cAMP-binding protein
MSPPRTTTRSFRTAIRSTSTSVPHRALMRNRLLAALPVADYARVGRSLDTIPLIVKHVLQKPGDPIRDVYFPGGGFCSILTVLEDGSMVEIATVGREGMIGVGAILDGGTPATSLTMVQAAAEICYRMPIDAFRREMDRRGRFSALITRYAHAHIGFVMQSTACNAKHSIEQRLARWLLLAHDRVGTDEFPLTQEFVAMMLGASRPTVTVVAGALQQARLITYHRGIVRILNRVQLEGVSCECYRVTTTMLDEVTVE